VLVDPLGDLFIADQGNSRVRRVDATGTITTVAGGAVRGFCGDGGAPTAACLDLPAALAMDVHGNLLIADGKRIRRVTCMPDSDHDGVCDAYDLSDLDGLTVTKAVIRSKRRRQLPSQLTVRFRARLDARTYAAANDGSGFLDQAAHTGVAVGLYVTPAPVSLASSPLATVRFAPTDCSFDRGGAHCSRATAQLTLSPGSAAGSWRLAATLRGLDETMPAAGPVRLVLSANDPGGHDYQAAAEDCAQVGRSTRALRCRHATRSH
jgi:hypothetical protein